jgi:hypothetical protein
LKFLGAICLSTKAAKGSLLKGTMTAQKVVKTTQDASFGLLAIVKGSAF